MSANVALCPTVSTSDVPAQLGLKAMALAQLWMALAWATAQVHKV